CTLTQSSREKVTERGIRTKIELGFGEIDADRARKRAIRRTTKSFGKRLRRAPSHQRGVSAGRARASCQAEFHADTRRSPRTSAFLHWSDGSILPGVAPSYKRGSAVIIEVKLRRHRTQPHVVGFVVGLVRDPSVDQVVRE